MILSVLFKFKSFIKIISDGTPAEHTGLVFIYKIKVSALPVQDFRRNAFYIFGRYIFTAAESCKIFGIYFIAEQIANGLYGD